MTHDLRAIGRRIATVRREMNLSQKDLAAKINISNNHLSNIEKASLHPVLRHSLTFVLFLTLMLHTS